MSNSKACYQITPIKAFTDNYIWMLGSTDSDGVYVVDPGDASPVMEMLKTHNLTLDGILITHHHFDHTGGVKQLKSQFDIPVYGPEKTPADCITYPLREGDSISCLGLTFDILQVPGHTLDHIAYLANPNDDDPILFCGDTLFAAGCGRLFEGTPLQMHKSLSKLSGLAENTRVFCTHEYTLSNLAFAKAVEPANPKLLARIDREQQRRNQDLPTLPSFIGLEKLTNPFLRTEVDEVIQAVADQLPAQEPAAEEVFAALRKWKDNF